MSIQEHILNDKLKQQDIEMDDLVTRLNEVAWLSINKWSDVDPLDLLEIKIKYKDRVIKLIQDNIKDLEDLQYKGLTKYLS